MPEDRARVEAMLRGTGLFWEWEIPIALEVFGDATGANPEGRVDRDYEAAGIEAEGQLVGWAAWGPTEGQPGSFDLYWIVVDPALQGHGLGSMLLAEMDRRIAGRVKRLFVETSGRADYAPTRAFYERHGYRMLDCLPNHFAPGDDLVRFVKEFAA